MRNQFRFVIGLSLIALSLYARRPPASPIVSSHVNNRHIDVIVIAKIIDVGYRIVNRTEAEMLAAKDQWDRIHEHKSISEAIPRNVLPEKMSDRLRQEQYAQTVYVMRLTARIESSLKGHLKKGDDIHVEWLAPIQNPQRAEADIDELGRSFPESSLSVLSLRKPSGGLEYYPEPDWSINLGDRTGLDELAFESQKRLYQNLIGQYIAYMDLLSVNFDNLSQRGRHRLSELWGSPDGQDRETLIAEWRTERARFNEWIEYQLSEDEKRQLVADRLDEHL